MITRFYFLGQQDEFLVVSQPAFFDVSQQAEEPDGQHSFFAVSGGGL